MSKTYKISDEIIEMFDQLQVAEACRNKCIDKVFGWKRAAHYGLEMVKWRRKAWNAVHEIYPELKTPGTTKNYTFGDNFITVTEGENNETTN